MAALLWTNRKSPTKYVSRAFGIEHWQVRAAIHTIKARSNLGAADLIHIYDNGDVTDVDGCVIGNIHDEV